MMGDAARVQQIVWNLLSNAIKFTPQRGQVEIRLTSQGMHAEIVVSDSGQGIEPGFLPYIFDRFQQADGSSTREVGGLGLGLSIVKQLVELHGGSVEAASGGKGCGATFTVRLPLRPAAAENRRHDATMLGQPEATGELPTLDGITVLVVDDEDDTRNFMQRVLSGRDARVLIARSAAEALAVLSHERPDILLSDIGMPEQDGYSLIRQVRALPHEQGGDIPAAALTAFTRAEDRKHAHCWPDFKVTWPSPSRRRNWWRSSPAWRGSARSRVDWQRRYGASSILRKPRSRPACKDNMRMR